VKQRAALSPRLGQFGLNWVNKFFCVLSFLSLVVFCFLLMFNIVPFTLFWLLDYPLLHTSSLLYWCDFFHRIHNTLFILRPLLKTNLHPSFLIQTTIHLPSHSSLSHLRRHHWNRKTQQRHLRPLPSPKPKTLSTISKKNMVSLPPPSYHPPPSLQRPPLKFPVHENCGDYHWSCRC